MTTARRALALLLLVASLAFALLGQFYFFSHRAYLWDGLIFHGLAVLCFLLAWRFSRRHPTEPGSDKSTSRESVPGCMSDG